MFAPGPMSQPAITVSPDDTVRHAAWLMYDGRVRRLPVVDSADRLAGIVSRTDVLTVYSRPGAAHHEAERSMNTCWAPRWASPTAG